MIENSQLLEYVGETWNTKLKNEISKFYLELKQKQYATKENNVYPMSIIRVTDPNQTEIKSIGMSCLNDLLNDNFGIWLGGMLTAIVGGVNLVNDSGSTQSINLNGASAPFNNRNTGVGSLMQVGKGTTPATRQDFAIENPFLDSPQSDMFNTGNGGYNSGLQQISIAGNVSPVVNSGQISECTLFFKWQNSSSLSNFFLMSRDNISPVVNFINGQSINVEYLINLS